MLKKLAIFISLLFFLAGCATTQQVKELQDKVGKIEKLSKKDILDAAEQAAGTKMYGRTARTGSNSLAEISYTSLVTGDQCIVIDSSLDLYFYKYDSTSSLSNNDPWVIQPTVPSSPSTGRWLLIRGIVLKNDDTNQSYARFYEDYTTGQNYYELTVPSSIAANSTFYIGRWRISPITVTTSSTAVTVDNTFTSYYCTIAGQVGNYGLSLPAATGSGVVIGVFVVDDTGDADKFIIEPNGTDRIVGQFSGTNGDGDYIYPVGKYLSSTIGGSPAIIPSADTSGQSIILVDTASGRWSAFSIVGEWSWE